MAKSQDGKVVLRIEDLDSTRSRPEYVDAFMKMLDETGLTYDEGPFFQSDNKARYAEVFENLSDAGLTYPCFCTRRDLSFQSAPHASDGIHVYDRRCLGLSDLEVATKTADLAKEGRKPSYRLLTDSRTIEFDDMLQGPQSCVLDADCGDFVIKRADDDFAYNLAVAIDDIEQGVNLVSRGCDLLDATPQQIYLYQLLGAEIPTYAHFPLICAKDGRRLAKRDKDATYDSMKEALGSPEHVIGRIAYIAGIQSEDVPKTPAQLLETFDLESVKVRYNGEKSIVLEE